MKKEMLINVLQAEETRIAILEDNILQELYIERMSNESIVGNVYKGRVVNIEPSIQAAFIDFGIGRNGFLHVSDVDPIYFPGGRGIDEFITVKDDDHDAQEQRRKDRRPRRGPQEEQGVSEVIEGEELAAAPVDAPPPYDDIPEVSFGEEGPGSESGAAPAREQRPQGRDRERGGRGRGRGGRGRGRGGDRGPGRNQDRGPERGPPRTDEPISQDMPVEEGGESRSQQPSQEHAPQRGRQERPSRGPGGDQPRSSQPRREQSDRDGDPRRRRRGGRGRRGRGDQEPTNNDIPRELVVGSDHLPDLDNFQIEDEPGFEPVPSFVPDREPPPERKFVPEPMKQYAPSDEFVDDEFGGGILDEEFRADDMHHEPPSDHMPGAAAIDEVTPSQNETAPTPPPAAQVEEDDGFGFGEGLLEDEDPPIRRNPGVGRNTDASDEEHDDFGGGLLEEEVTFPHSHHEEEPDAAPITDATARDNEIESFSHEDPGHDHFGEVNQADPDHPTNFIGHSEHGEETAEQKESRGRRRRGGRGRKRGGQRGSNVSEDKAHSNRPDSHGGIADAEPGDFIEVDSHRNQMDHSSESYSFIDRSAEDAIGWNYPETESAPAQISEFPEMDQPPPIPMQQDQAPREGGRRGRGGRGDRDGGRDGGREGGREGRDGGRRDGRGRGDRGGRDGGRERSGGRDRGPDSRDANREGDRRGPPGEGDRGRRQGRPQGGRSGGGRFIDPRRPRDRPPIQEIFRRGQEVLVQVIKEGVGNKGPTLSTYISIPGRYLVLMPGLNRTGVSRKITDEEQRRRLRDAVADIQRPKGIGFIIRTAGLDRSKVELERDLAYLTRLWEVVIRRLRSQKAPISVYQESDMIIRTIRDIFTAEIEKIVIDEPSAYERCKEFLHVVMPKFADRLGLYSEAEPLFHRYGVEEEISKLHRRNVPLPHGGSIVIDQTEALVAIDVNSGNFRAEGNAEETAYQINLAAAKEIARQLRLRDMGGVIVNDFIDMREERHRRGVERSLHEALKRDRARTKQLRMSQFGLIQMTRQRIRPSLRRSLYRECPCCRGTAQIKTVESLCVECLRMLSFAAQSDVVVRIDLRMDAEAATFLQNHKRKELGHLEAANGVTINITGIDTKTPDVAELKCYNGSGDIVEIGLENA